MKASILKRMGLLGVVVMMIVVATVASDAGTNRSAAWIGEKVFDGRTGPWLSEARLQTPKQVMAEARAAGKTEAVSPGLHHLDFSVAESRPKTAILIHDGKGSITVTRPDGQKVTRELASLGDHLAADLALDQPGEYRFTVTVARGNKTERSLFGYTVR
jgi:hypothetical protein